MNRLQPGERHLTHVFHRHLRGTLPTAVGGEGVYLIDAAGKRYLDASGGAAVSALGHGDPDIRAAIREQVDSLAFAHTAFFTSEPAERLADALIDGAPGDMACVYFTSGGSEAVEDRAQDGAPLFRRDRRGPAHPLHRAAPELSRQHARRAGRRRQRRAPEALRAAADGDHPYLALPCLSRPAVRRKRGGLWPARRRRTGRGDPPARAGYGHGVRR